MTAIRVQSGSYAIPLDRVTRISTRNVSERHFVVVSVEDPDGRVGWGYCYAGTVAGPQVAGFINEIFAPELVRLGDLNPVTAWAKLYQEVLLVGRRGLAIRALSALDIALWDLRAKRAGMPLATLLGGDADAGIPAYASGGYYVETPQKPADYVRDEILRNRELGFADHKIKVGGSTVRGDAARVAAAIEAIDGTGRLALDANNAYRSVPEALAALREFEAAAGGALWWFEEPLSPDDIRGHAALADQRALTPIATGEIHQTRWDFAELVERRAASFLQVDVGVAGGVTEYLRVGQTAESFGLQLAPHWHANLHAQLAAASTNTVAVEHFALEKDIYNFEKLVPEDQRLAFGDGQVRLSDRPGIGFEFDEDALAGYLMPTS